MERVTLIIIAMNEELNALLSSLDNYEHINNELGDLYLYKKNNINYVITLGKIGKVSTAYFIGKLSMKYQIERIFNIGTSGALTSSINVGDVVVASGVIYNDVDVVGFGYEEGQIPSMPRVYYPDDNYIIFKGINTSDLSFKVVRGLVASGDSFITKNNYDKLPNFVKENALCSEMESGSVAQCATMMGVPFIVIRSISDYVLNDDNGNQMDLNMEQVCENCAKVLLKFL